MSGIKRALSSCSTVLAGLMALTLFSAPYAIAAQVQLPGATIATTGQFVDPLPGLSVAGGPVKTIIANGTQIELHMREFKANMMPTGFVPGVGTYDGTWVWGYINGPTAPVGTQGTYTGPVIVNTRNKPTQIKYVNDLGTTDTTNLLFWKNAVDQTLMWADPLNDGKNDCHAAETPGVPPVGACATNYSGPIPAVPHLHGGEVPPAIDGGPNAWFMSDGSHFGNGYYTKGYKGAVAALPKLPNTSYPPNTIVFNKADNKYYKVNPGGGAWALLNNNYCVYRYPNAQEAAPIWFHDHLMGGTRLNVYAGLAGAYLIVDPNNPPPANLQKTAEIIPMVIQDRMFDTDGQLFFPNTPINPEHPFWVPEFIGDTVCVNGKVWPYLSVQPKRYRFLLINGSNARSYDMYLADQTSGDLGPAIWQIETDGGYLDKPVKIDPNATSGLKHLVMMPGERAGIVIDFAGMAGKTLIIKNEAAAPLPSGDPVDPATTGLIMQIRVDQPLAKADTSYDPSTLAPLRRNKIVRLPGTPGGPASIVTDQGEPGGNVLQVRQLTLNEVEENPVSVGGIDYPGGPAEILVNNTTFDGMPKVSPERPDFLSAIHNGKTTFYSELPAEGTTEIWEYVNLTMDAHPMHTHLTQFQLINRQAYRVPAYFAAYEAAFPNEVYVPGDGPPLDYYMGNWRALGGNPDVTPYLKGLPFPPNANEQGWKDTVMAPPGMVTRIAVRFSPENSPLGTSRPYPFNPNVLGFDYVFHCHIVDHEDNEMMRTYMVLPKKGVTRTYNLGSGF